MISCIIITVSDIKEKYVMQYVLVADANNDGENPIIILPPKPSINSKIPHIIFALYPYKI